MKKKIVLMKNVKYNLEAVKVIYSDYDLEYWMNDNEYVCISEPVEVELPELKGEEVIKSQVAIIDKQITKINANAQAALTALEGRKAELLSITYKPVE